MCSLKIGVFDSGVGGLSITKELRQRWPQLSISFFCDNANFPYGTKSEAEVGEFVLQSVEAWQHHEALDALIIACNTASTIVLPALRSHLRIPVIGVVPAIKPAAGRSVSKHIGLLATPATVKRAYTDELIQQFAVPLGVVVTKIGSSRLVEIAEAKLRGVAPSVEEIRQIIRPFFDAKGPPVDHIVLGCTHFPLLVDELKMAVAPEPMHWVDSAAAIVERLDSILGDKLKDSVGTSDFYFSVDSPSARQLETQLGDFGFGRIRYLLTTQPLQG